MMVADKELLIDHFVELRRHFKQMEIMMPDLIKLYKDETKSINNIPESDYKEKLNNNSEKIKKELFDLEKLTYNALILIEDILKIRETNKISENKFKLKKIIPYLSQVLDKIQNCAFESMEIEKAWKKTINKKCKAVKISVCGKLNNGWSLSKIQNVINELGGEVQTNRGSHPLRSFFQNIVQFHWLNQHLLSDW